MDPAWPAEIRSSPISIKRGYDLARRMLQPVPIPSYKATPRKLIALATLAKALPEADFYRAPLTVSYEDGLVNAAGVQQCASTMSGNESTGVNDGSKTTTLVTYVADAWNYGAEIFCLCSVERVAFKEETGKWVVYFQWLDVGLSIVVQNFENSF